MIKRDVFSSLGALERRWVARLALNRFFIYKSTVKLFQMLQHFGSEERIFLATSDELSNFLSWSQIEEFLHPKLLQKATEEWEMLQQQTINLLAYDEEYYPPLLLECKDRPFMLYQKGNCNLQNERCIAIVGTRNYSDYGAKITKELVKQLIPYQPIIVSGLAQGVDSIAHQQALLEGLETVAVMGTDVISVYPSEHKILSQKIQERGCLLSEFPLGIGPEKYNFPIRNRVVAGMTVATIVIETDVKGGSMITAKLALGYDRDVMTFPHSILNPKGKGCHQLIKQQMAYLIECGDDIAHILGWDKKNNDSLKKEFTIKEELLTESERKIITLLRTSKTVHIDQINATFIYETNISLALLQLEMEGLIETKPGGFYSLA